MTSILPFTARNAHPGFLGWVQGGGTPVGMLAEMLAAGLNANLGGRDQIPLQVEDQITEWMRSLFGFPASATGLFVTGTSMANFLAVVVARDARLGCDVRRQGVAACTGKLTAYASSAVHGCVGRALDFAGLGSDALRLIPVNGRQQMDLEALEHTIPADLAAGSTPFLVVEQPVGDERWDYRRVAVERIHTAVRNLLMTSAGARPSRTGHPDSNAAGDFAGSNAGIVPLPDPDALTGLIYGHEQFYTR